MKLRKALVVGSGAIARQHARNLLRLVPGIELATFTRTGWKADEGDGEIPAVSFTELEPALQWGPQMAVLANPCSHRLAIMRACVEAGIHLFLEKPIADKPEGVTEILQACRERGLVVSVGYCLRYYEPLVQARRYVEEGRLGRLLSIQAFAAQYLPDWRPQKRYQETVSARRELGGGALLELSHELDLLRWICGELEVVHARVGRYSDLEIDVEDCADILLKAEDELLCSLHLNFMRRPGSRTYHLHGTRGALCWDSSQPMLNAIDHQSGEVRELLPEGPYGYDHAFCRELESFLACMEGREAGLASDGWSGLRTLELVEAVRQACG